MMIAGEAVAGREPVLQAVDDARDLAHPGQPGERARGREDDDDQRA